MNILLWVLQALLAVHTVMGAVWKFSNTQQAVPSLSAFPHPLWLGLSGVELLCSVGFVLPAIYAPSAMLAPSAASVIAAEMLLCCGVLLASGEQAPGPIAPGLVAAAPRASVAYGRFVLGPL